ncbi:P-loop containing nucleoside triphosphate hydrolase protein [Gaertneriomyces semiglobifer]|nr:P-loop containing nucleoside triphosphate hydrolase protein [Gaertneriomyces semiglobifer]
MTAGLDDLDAVEEVQRAGSSKAPLGQLWVDKYAPRQYIDLVGDEHINREVLTWVKEWDWCVFKKERRGAQRSQARSQKYEKFESEKDPLRRPDKKVLLLTGPPGLGKTTLAHVIARQAGYNVVEINASDDRTGDAVRTKLVGALETQSVLGSRKPHLVVIDEIDGVSATGQGDNNFIKLLISFITGEHGVSSKNTGKPSGGANKAAPRRKALLRPVICICNDPYAPVLRPLRPYCQMYTFRTPPLKILARRLHEICAWEGLKTDMPTLTALCELTEGDIRSCLNSLQFLRQKTTLLTIDMVSNLNVGHKDMSKGLFKVWEEIFVTSNARKKKVMESMDSTTSGRYLQSLHALISASGEYDRIMQGCFESYLHTKIFDTVASAKLRIGETAATKIEQILDWLSFYDKVDHSVHSKHVYELSGYLPYSLANFHRFFASAVRIRFEFPRTEYLNFVAHQAHRNVLGSLISGLPPLTRRQWNSPASAAVELVSFLLRILGVEIRAVNIQLIKPAEREALQRLVAVMVSLGFKFHQEKLEDGQYTHRLDP